MCSSHYRVGPSYRIPLLVTFFCFTGLIAKSQWMTSGSNIYNTNVGNVGVNITAPLVNLHVQGQIAATTYNAGGLAGFVESWADNAIIWKNGNGNGGLRFGSANDLGAGGWSEKMRFTDAGSLGIGTTSPRTRLDVW